MKEISSVCILGAGNVATHFAKSIKKTGLEIVQIYNRKETKARELAEFIGCSYISDINKIYENAGLYLFAVSDSAILPILNLCDWKNKFLVHTSGFLPSNIFKPFTKTYGCIYPLQSFTKDRELNFLNIPFFIEANSTDTLASLNSFTSKLSEKVQEIDPVKKSILHLAAVFANNFSNHMYSIAFELLKRNNLPFEYLGPLIEETMHKAQNINPGKAQTGPAVRNDQEVLKQHIEMLTNEPEWQKIYTFVSESIQKYYNSSDGEF